MKEVWKDIKGYEGLYQVSNFGRVKRLDRFRKHWKGGLSLYKECFLKGTLNNNGYLNVKLYKCGLKKTISIHRLVALSFILNKNELKEVNHIDCNKINNTVSNLEWVTKRENQTHRYNNSNTTTGITGVRYCSWTANPWLSEIRINNKTIYLGTFKNRKEAHNAYLKALQDFGLKNKYATI